MSAGARGRIPDAAIHPAADLFPMMGDAELARLADDIKANGLRSPVVLDKDGRVLDGRNRLRACKAAGVTAETVTWNGEDAVGYVVSLNLHRRHLDESQRAMVGAGIEAMYAVEAAKRRTGRPRKDAEKKVVAILPPPEDDDSGKARTKAAETVNVSPRLITDAKKVIASGAPELVAAVRAGSVTVSDAVKVLDAEDKEQAAYVASVAAGESKTVRAAQKRASYDENAAIEVRRKKYSSVTEICSCIDLIMSDAQACWPGGPTDEIITTFTLWLQIMKARKTNHAT